MRCSFCHRHDSAVDKLVAGPRRLFRGPVYICDRCATETIRIMESNPGGDPPRPRPEPLLRRALHRFGWWRRSDLYRRSACTAT